MTWGRGYVLVSCRVNDLFPAGRNRGSGSRSYATRWGQGMCDVAASAVDSLFVVLFVGCIVFCCC